MLVRDSEEVARKIRKKDPLEVARICLGWISTEDYSHRDAFIEGLTVGLKKPKRVIAAKLKNFTFFFDKPEKTILREVSSLPDLP